jgi:hypothetical protein
MYNFMNVPGHPTSTTDVDIIFTATDMRTFGQSWYGSLLPPSNPLYNELIYSIFPWEVSVTLEG